VTAADRVIRWTTAGAVAGVVAVAAVASYEHAYALVLAHVEAGSTGRLVPLTVLGSAACASNKICMTLLHASHLHDSVTLIAIVPRQSAYSVNDLRYAIN
jgi:hypothetical protein